MEITNKTKRPLRIPLPGGKKLHLGPGKTGQVTPKALESPALEKLIEEGEIEVAVGGRTRSAGGSDGGGSGPSQTDSGGGSIRRTGDR